MSRHQGLLGVVIAVVAITSACGDNSAQCGPGTHDDHGECLPSAVCGPGTVASSDGLTCVPDGMCTDGTKFDPVTGHCVIDPNSCQGGTVLIDNVCQDPTAGLTVDLEEGGEPNGLGILGEASDAPAGVAALKAVGGAAYVIHGTIVPADHDGDGVLDNDADTYVIAVQGPTYLDVTADGVHGLTAATITVANVASGDPLATYKRFGLNTTGDTSARQLFLPKAGTYLLAVTDARPLFLTGAVAGAAPGAPAFEYYVSIKNLAIPAPTVLPVTGGIATAPAGDTLGRDLKFFTAALGNGMNEATLQANDTTAIGSLIVMNNTTFRNLADEASIFGTFLPADVGLGGITGTDQPYFVVDDQYNYAFQPTPYNFQITTDTAVALSATGAKVGDAEHSSAPAAITDYNYFYFDVAAADDTVGFNLAWDVPTDVALVDGDDRVVAPFTWTQGFANGDTMTSFSGLVRFKKPGRYYFQAYDPAGGSGTLNATSKFATLVPAAVTTSTPLAGQAVSADYDALPFSYASNRATQPWQLFTTTASSAGGAAVEFYNPGDAYGRLDPLDVSGTATAADPTPLFTGETVGRILLDDPSDTYYVHARPAAASGARDLTLDFTPRAFHDYGTIAIGTNPATVTDATTKAANPPKYYLLKAGGGDRMTVTAHPTNTVSTVQNLAIDVIAADESVVSTANAGGLGANETALALVSHGGWLAFAVRETAIGATSNYAVDVAGQDAVAYTIAAGTTAYADACVGGTTRMSGSDEFVSAAITAPAGFELYGVPVSTFTVSSNGFLAFSNPAKTAAFDNVALPALDGIDGMIAPYWDDLNNMTVCTKVIGTKLVVQWNGTICDFDFTNGFCKDGATVVSTQAILDGSDSSIELVYGPTEAAFGASATIGIEDPVSSHATQIGFDANVIAAGSSKKLTPGP